MKLRSLLFAPANRPDLIDKLPRSHPDAVVIDLEDAVPRHLKFEARVIAKESLQKLLETSPVCKVFLRTNPLPSTFFLDDADVLVKGMAGVILPKVESEDHLEQAHQVLRSKGFGDVKLIAGIETARGVFHAQDIFHPALLAIYFGAEDFITDMNGVRTAEALEVLYARSQVVLAARVHGVIALDIIEANFRDGEAFRKSALCGRSLGYAGKMCIHPQQVPLANEIFSASLKEKERAKALLEAYQHALKNNLGVFEFEGQMIDEPMLERARVMLGEV